MGREKLWATLKGDEARELAAFINAGLGRYRAAAFELSRDTWVILDDLEGPVNPPPIDDVGRYLGPSTDCAGWSPSRQSCATSWSGSDARASRGLAARRVSVAGAAGADVSARKRA